MGVIHQQLALDDVTPGMVLADNLLDAQGQILLPKGAELSEQMLESLRRHDISSLRIFMGELSEEEAAAQRAYLQSRLTRLFRNSDGEDANGLLQNYVRKFRLGEQP
ncbi:MULTISPECIES: hypothetical protein [Oxalobacteraceae]|uniref:hypothetical protein n=1 Tax=Herminiimonas sp. Marseille-P9896 TaxID=2742211 RepID=UPI00158DE31B|nr:MULTISPECIES: hypothetical protein [Oxalobacteraceae]